MHLKGGANLLNQWFLLLARPLYGPSLVFRSRYRRRLAARLLPVLPPRPQGNRRTSSPISSLMSDESTFSCPCGWNPSQMPLALLSVWRQRHWRNCHGKPQPRLTPEGTMISRPPPHNTSRDTTHGAYHCRRKLMHTFVKFSLTSCFDRQLKWLNTSSQNVASSVAWRISGVILAMLALSPGQSVIF